MPKPPVPSSPDASAQDTEHHQQLAQSGAAVQSSVVKRRKFTAADKLRIIRKADECLASGQRGALEALLRQEGIYASQLGAWRAKLASSGSSGLTPAKAGRKPKHTAAERRLAELEKRNAELERKLHVAEVLIALQKKAHELLGLALPESDGES